MSSHPSCLILYGSELGNTEEISKIIYTDIEPLFTSYKLTISLQLLNSITNIQELNNYKIVIFACSTTGDGEPPSNALKFFKSLRTYINDPHSSKLTNLNFTVLALGDSNYSNYARPGRELYSILSSLNAIPFHPLVCADNAIDMEPVIEEFRVTVVKELEILLKKLTYTIVNEIQIPAFKAPPLRPCDISIEYNENIEPDEIVYWRRWKNIKLNMNEPIKDDVGNTMDSPFLIGLTNSKILTQNNSGKCTIHLEFSTPSNLSLTPGDALGVFPINSHNEVNNLLKRLDYNPNLSFSIIGSGSPYIAAFGSCTIKQAFLFALDISLTSPAKKSLLRMLAESAAKESEKNILLYLTSREGSELYKDLIVSKRPTLLQILNKYPSCKPQLANLISELPHLQPRYYSCSNAIEKYPNQLHVAFSVVGLCTNWLRDQCVKSGLLDGIPHRNFNGDIYDPVSDKFYIPAFLKKTGHFSPPPTLNSRMILIGPGTGIAPFMGFLQSFNGSRSKEFTFVDAPGKLTYTGSPSARAILFFGCRNRNSDFIYKRELEDFVTSGNISNLFCAFSRETDRKVYVQDLIREQKSLLLDEIKGGAYIFICGDGQKMAGDVKLAFEEIMESDGLSKDEAKLFIKKLVETNKYVVDVW